MTTVSTGTPTVRQLPIHRHRRYTQLIAIKAVSDGPGLASLFTHGRGFVGRFVTSGIRTGGLLPVLRTNGCETRRVQPI